MHPAEKNYYSFWLTLLLLLSTVAEVGQPVPHAKYDGSI